jgi:hypothetical protein
MKKIAVLSFLLGTCLVLLVFAAFRHHSRRAAHEMIDSVATGEEDSSPVPARHRFFPPRLPALAFDEEGKPFAPVEVKSTDAPERKSEKEILQELNSAFNADRPPDANSTKMSSGIVSAFGDVRAQGARLTGLECRATRCRLGIDFADVDADKRVMSDIFNLLSSAGLDVATLGFIVATRDTRPDGTINATVHLFHISATL